jgi:hypothetical protein
VRAPLNPAHGVLMPHQVRLTRTTDGAAVLRRAGARAELYHAAVPDTQGLVDAAGGKDKRAVLVPIEGEQLAAGGGHRERSGSEWGGEGVGGGREGGRAQVEEAHSAVGGAGGDEIGLVWGEEGLVDARVVGLEGREGAWPFGGPLPRVED